METVATIDRCDRVVWGRRGGQDFKVYTYLFEMLEHSLIIFETRFEFILLHFSLLFIRKAFTNSTFEYK
jgi:hypothetical protein